MRDWYLGPGDPLCLTLVADARLCTPDYANDHIWELELGDGEPAALALRTTYGLRARTMRLFPRFTEQGKSITNPASFAAPPRLRRFYPNFLVLNFSPFVGIEINAEYWVPSSQSIAARLSITNHTVEARQMRLEWAGLLVPLEGQSLALVQIQGVNILAGQTADLAPVVFLTGGSEAGPGPYPSLLLDVGLAPGATRQFTLAQAALTDTQASFELARRTAARPWDAERAKIELLNASQTVEIHTGDLDWDAAFAFSQKIAFGLFFGGNENLPHPSFVLARQPDHGHSRQGGSDYPPLWSGQSPLEAYYLDSLLPGAPELAGGLLRNFLFTQGEDGAIDCRPGLAGQRGRFLAPPLLASLAWKIYARNEDLAFLAEVFPSLLAFFHAWLRPEHDRDGDGFPEWVHHLQTGFEDNPVFAVWQDWGQGADITTFESPALAAMLYAECRTLARMAAELGQAAEEHTLQLQAVALRTAAEECWDDNATLYHCRDRDTHYSQAGRLIAEQRGRGTVKLRRTRGEALRLLIGIQIAHGVASRFKITITGHDVSGEKQTEHLERGDFHWYMSRGVATSQSLHSGSKIKISGLDSQDLVTIWTVDHACEDHTLFLPLWAGIPNVQRARTLVSRSLLNAERFYRPCGVPACPLALSRVEPPVPDPAAESTCLSVHMPWNHFIGEGLLAYGYRAEAARLIAHLMTAVIQNLKRARAFYHCYHAENGTGIGERNALSGLAPVELFLETLGVRILSPECIRLEGQNPFPWPVTVKYRGTTVTRLEKQTQVIFSDGQTVTIQDPGPQVVSR